MVPLPDAEAELLWERERRLGAEARLQDAYALIEELRQELDSSNTELRNLSEELQEMTKVVEARQQR